MGSERASLGTNEGGASVGREEPARHAVGLALTVAPQSVDVDRRGRGLGGEGLGGHIEPTHVPIDASDDGRVG